MPIKILVLDDEESIRFSFRRFLTAQGHEVTTAASYGAAMEKMDETYFDLILADMILGDGYGINILHEVIKRILKTRVIIMTAYPTTETVRNSFHFKAFDYLIKPLCYDGLVDAVNLVIGHQGNGAGDVSARLSMALSNC